VLEQYADMVCLGTVADVMPLQGENRVFVARGLESLKHTHRPGIAALMTECGCAPETVNASSIGFMLAPRINAAGRMGRIELAIELFLTDDEERAGYLAKALCELNKQRQNVEAQIYNEAVSMLPEGKTPAAIVLADESWHQGVVGIVASRMAEEYCCPAFLICLDGDHGKASSRSYGGFNLFSSLTKLAPLLESYGGHELAAGFTITRQQIPSFRQAICELAEQHYTDGVCRTQIEIDCAVTPELLTVRGIDSLSALEPCGNGCPKPVLMMEKLTIDRISLVGGGRHMRLRFRDRYHTINAIFFSATPESASVQPGDVVDVAFYPQINEFKGERSVQMNVLDIRPHCDAPCDTNTAGYAGLRKGETTPAEAAQLLPDRNTLGMVWRYLAGAEAPLREEPMCLCRKIVRWSGKSLTLGQLLTALDIFRDVGLLEIQKQRKTLTLIPTPGPNKADLNESKTMQTLLKAKES
jgi:single-stranded-DNA-specific exonuclease